LIKQSWSERLIIDWFITLQGGPKHTEECIPQESPTKNETGYALTRQFSSIFSSGSEPTFFGTRLTGSPTHERLDSRRYHTVASRGTHLCAPGIVVKGSLVASIRY
jgi:hypothetical protein